MVGKTVNRQVWIDFPYPKEIFLALCFDRFCLEIKKRKRQCLLQREPGSFLQSGKRLSVGLLH